MGFWQRLGNELFLLPQDETAPRDPEQATRVAACALLLEVAHADDSLGREEAAALLRILKDEFGLTEDEAAELQARADKRREESLDLYQFTATLNAQWDKAARVRMVERLWEIVYADGRLDGHEDLLMHRLAELLNLHHADLIEAKLKAKKNSAT